MAKPVIGVLALQGAVEPHRKHIEAAGGEFRAVKTPGQFEDVDAFILPGGESTTMLKLIETFDLWDSLKKQFAEKPVWGICAGSILIAENVTSPAQKSFGLLPVTVQRNAYGRQLQSSHAVINGYDISLIRAPVIAKVANDVTVKAEHEGKPVWVEKGRYMATTFHPELTLDYPSPMHREFVNLVQNYKKKAA
ncbi:MAG: pyridoxal 5'-phosphate synthase glutaminase subunit PdxT [Alphaproteobacteria bacterium PRO2]|nr:pyridoxal 5'-phosphate synthase glutaminase subunit PdxT [Alphaproteobacteria bacterium PRO2]